MKRVIGVSGFAVAAWLLVAACGSQASPPVALDARVAAALESGQPVSVLVYLKDSADVTASAVMADKPTKGAFVFGKLKDHAARTQQPLLDFIARAGHADVQAFHIVNALV